MKINKQITDDGVWKDEVNDKFLELIHEGNIKAILAAKRRLWMLEDRKLDNVKPEDETDDSKEDVEDLREAVEEVGKKKWYKRAEA